MDSKPANKQANSEKKLQKVYKRHQRIWSFFWHTAKPFFKWKYGYTAELAPEIDGPCLILANHNCNLDPVLVGFSFRKQMYFVASEHVYRQGFVSKLLFWGFEPIAKMKGTTDTLAVMKAIRTLRNGKNVCIFPEGNRSFNGRTGPIFDATGKLVKTSGATLVTYKIEGGYFTNPRWGYKIRKGKCTGKVVNIYKPEQLKEMDAAEITACVRRDLDENAYERQKQNPIKYKGKNLAQGMECALCVCPKCREVGTIASKANTVFCKKCGLSTSYSEYCYFDDDFPFHTVEEWDLWQDEYFKTYIEENKDSSKVLFEDSDMTMKTITADHKEEVVGCGTLSLYNDRLEFKPVIQPQAGANAVTETASDAPTVSIPISEITDIALFLKDNLVFSNVAGTHYEVKGTTLKNVRKYVHVCKFIKEKN